MVVLLHMHKKMICIIICHGSRRISHVKNECHTEITEGTQGWKSTRVRAIFHAERADSVFSGKAGGVSHWTDYGI